MSDTFTCKTDKDGGFKYTDQKHVPKNPFTGNLVFDKISLSGKLTRPSGTTVDGALTFNGSKKSFKKKTGETQEFGSFTLKADNTLVLEGTATSGDAPPKAGTELTFEVAYETS
jgi:hypothetical protein